MVLQQTLDTFLKSDVMVQNYSIQRKTTLSVKDGKCIEHHELSALRRFKQSKAKQYKAIVSYVLELMKGKSFETRQTFKNFLNTLPFEYQQNSVIKRISTLEKVELKTKKSGKVTENQKFKSKKGQITVVQFWTSWNALCLQNIQQNLQILEQYDNIEYVAISLDDSQEDHYEGMKEILAWQGSHKLNHYRFMDGFDPLNPFIRGLNIVKLPYILIIDEQQQLHYKGHPRVLQQILSLLVSDKPKYQKKKFDEVSRITSQLSRNQIQRSNPQLMGFQDQTLDKSPLSALEVDDSEKSDAIPFQNNFQLLKDDEENILESDDDEDDDIEEEEEESQQTQEEGGEIDDVAFDAMKMYLQEQITESSKLIKYKGLNITLTETQTLFLNAKREIAQKNLVRSKILINYSLPKSESDNLEAFKQSLITAYEEEFWEFFDFEKVIVIEGDYIDDEEQIRTKIVDFFLEYVKIKVQIFDEHSQSITWTSAGPTEEQSSELKVNLSDTPDLKLIRDCKIQISNYIDQNFQGSIKEYGYEILELILKACQLKPGMKFQTISNYEDDEGELVEIKVDKNSPLLVFYLNPDYLEILQFMIRFNCQRKEDKYAIFAINRDYGSDQKRSDNHFNDSSTKLCYPRIKQKDPNQFDQIAYGPSDGLYVIVVDQHGEIVKSFQPKSRWQMEELMKNNIQTLKENQKSQQSQNTTQNFDLSEQVNKINYLVKNNDFGDKYCFQLTFEVSYQIPLGEQPKNIQYDKLIMEYRMRDFQQSILEKELESVQNFTIKNKEIIITKGIQNYELPLRSCVLCQQKLSLDKPSYYSYFRTEYVCCSCAEYEDKKQSGYEQFKYKDTLIYINAPLKNLKILDHIEEYKFGKNIQKEILDRQHHFVCNGCRLRPLGSRYICITCLPGINRNDFVDFCCECFLRLKKRGSADYHRIIERNAAEGMTEDFLLLRVIFDNGYLDY